MNPVDEQSGQAVPRVLEVVAWSVPLPQSSWRRFLRRPVRWKRRTAFGPCPTCQQSVSGYRHLEGADTRTIVHPDHDELIWSRAALFVVDPCGHVVDEVQMFRANPGVGVTWPTLTLESVTYTFGGSLKSVTCTVDGSA